MVLKEISLQKKHLCYINLLSITHIHNIEVLEVNIVP